MTPGETVSAFIAAINRRQLEEALTLLADDVRYDNVPIGEVVGHDATRQVLGPLVDGATEVDWVVHRQVEAGEVVVNERTDRFHLPGGWMELPVAGVFEVADGRIALWRDYFDLAAVTTAMAALAAPPAG